MIAIGPAGLGPVKTAISTLDSYHAKGFKACEIAFTYGAYIKSEEEAQAIGAHAKKLGIALSIHASYFVNLGSDDPAKRAASKQRILECCKVGSWLGAHTVVFHPGYYLKQRELTCAHVKENIREMMAECKKNEWNIALAPETMGKVNVFGSLDEIAQLVKETKCSFCIDFAHLLARDKSVDYEKVRKLFPQKRWHVHFSGIEYGEKGEKNHIPTGKKEWQDLLQQLPRDTDITLVNESPSMIKDCIQGLSLAKKAGFSV